MEKEKRSILVVDDDDTVRESAKAFLQSEGYNVDTAATGLEAIQKSEARYYDLALLDIKLPDMEGTKLLIEMHRGTPRMMKIMLTGYPSLENAVEALNLGADAYLMKPVRPQELLKVVEEKLNELEAVESMSMDRVTEWVETRARKLRRKLESDSA